MIEPYQQQEIVDKLLNLNLTVIQIGGPGISEPYINSKAINLINKTTIEQSIAMIKYADLFVGSDSFCQHAAAFTRTPAVVYWAGTSPKDFGYNFFSNIVYPDIVSCQNKCANPMRWLYNYDYKDKNIWNTRSETGWVCPTKICTKAIKIDDIIVAVNKELEIGHNRDWSFKNYEYTNSTSSIRN
jgi:ADP-heptose:LPS heptosyltransferase